MSDEHRYQDQVNEWMAWLDWSVRFVRPTWEANVNMEYGSDGV